MISARKSKFGFAVLLMTSLLTSCGKSEPAQMGANAPPTGVEVVTLQSTDVNLTAELPGRAVAFRKAEVRPQVTGVIQKRLFDEGSIVEAGQQLYQIDAARYDAAVATAKATLERARSNLNAARDRYNRFTDLLKQKAVSQQNYDDAEVTFMQSKAELAVAEAALQTAQIDLDYTRVYAPINGRIGKSNVTEGALVTAQQTAVLATIHQLDPIYVDLAQSARQIIDIRQQLAAGTLALEDFAPVKLRFENGREYGPEGKLRFAEMSVDVSTGTVALRAEFPNPEHMLLPGMFVRAEVYQGTREQVLLIPQRAVSRGRGGQSQVMVVGADNKVEGKMVTLGIAVGTRWVVEGGLNAGDRVIVEGLQKVGPGVVVNPVEQTEAVTQTQ